MTQYQADNLSEIDQEGIKDLKKIYESHYNELVRFAFKHLNNVHLAEDVVQDVFITLWEKRDSIDINKSVKSYMFTSVRNHSINYLRSKYKRTIFIELSDFVLHGENETDNDLISSDLTSLIERSIERLPNKCKIIFLLSRNFGMTYDEIASHLNLSKRTVHTQIGIALKKIRKQLGKNWYLIPGKE